MVTATQSDGNNIVALAIAVLHSKAVKETAMQSGNIMKPYKNDPTINWPSLLPYDSSGALADRNRNKELWVLKSI